MPNNNVIRSTFLSWLIGPSAGLLYLLTLAPGLLWQDSAMFQLRVWHTDLTGQLGLALSHPLYIILARAFTAIVPGDFAWRVNLFSAVCSAAAIGFIFAALARLSRSNFAALIAAAILALSHTFWTHAVIAEVYGLYALLLSIEIYLLVRYQQAKPPRSAPWLIALFLVNGLNISNHLLALLHLPIYGLYALLQLRARRIRLKHLILIILAGIVGAAIYETMIITQIVQGAGFANTIRSALFGNYWQDRVIGATPNTLDLAKCLGYFLMNFPTPLLLLAPAGIYLALKDHRTRPVAAVCFATCALTFVFALRYQVPDQFVFFFPCYVFTAIFIGLAVAQITQLRPRLASMPLAIAILLLALLPALTYEIAPAAIRKIPFLARITDKALRIEQAIPGRDPYTYFLRPRKNGDHSAAGFSLDALELAEPHGLICADNTTRNPIICSQQIRRQHTGVYLTKGSDLKAGLEAPADLPTVQSFLDAGRQVFIVSPARQRKLAQQFEAAGRFSLVPRGPLYEVKDKSTEAQRR